MEKGFEQTTHIFGLLFEHHRPGCGVENRAMGAKVEAGTDATDSNLTQVVLVERAKYPLCAFLK